MKTFEKIKTILLREFSTTKRKGPLQLPSSFRT